MFFYTIILIVDKLTKKRSVLILKKGFLSFVFVIFTFFTANSVINAEEIQTDLNKEEQEFIKHIEEVEQENKDLNRDPNLFKSLTDQDFTNALTKIEEIISENKNLTEEELNQLAYELFEEIHNKKVNENFITPLYISIGGANLQELALCARHPIDCSRARNDATKANTQTEAYYSSGLHNGNGDAFRHAYWNKLMVGSIGATRAAEFANAHEYGNHSQPDIEKQMDLFNNQKGRSWSAYSAARIRDEISKGGGKRIVNNTLVATTSAGLK